MGCEASTSADSPEDDTLMAGVCFVQRSGKREDIKHGSPVRNRLVPAGDPKEDTEEKYTEACENRSAQF